MKTLLFLFTWGISTYNLMAQYGITGQYVTGNITSTLSGDIASIKADGYHGGINYWMRLKNLRVEFYPELSYTGLKSKTGESLAGVNLQQWAFTLPASFYLLDFKGDCKCPTFSKQNDFFKKGWFLQVLGSVQQEGTKIPNSETSWHQNYVIGAGSGLDIGLSDLLTITPLIQYLRVLHSSRNKEGYGTSDQVKFGVRITFRPDYR